MSMSKKDYESLAFTVKEKMYYLDDRTRKLVASDLAYWIYQQDKTERFDVERFTAACGVPVRVYE